MACAFGMLSLDGSDPSSLPESTDRAGEFLYWVASDGALVATSGRSAGLWIEEVGSTGRFQNQGGVSADELNAEGLALSGDHLYIAAQDAGLVIAELSPLSLVGELPSANAIDVEVSGSFAYVLDRDEGLIVVDVSDPARPLEVSTLPLDGTAQAIALGDSMAVLAMGHLLTVVDISTPDAPLVLGSIDTNGLGLRVAVDGDLVAIANWADVRVFDISEPTAPRMVAVEAAKTWGGSVAMADGVLWVGDWDDLRTFRVDGTLHSPEISFDRSFDVNGANGDSVQAVVIVENEGDLTLEVTDVACRGGITPDTTAFTLEPGTDTTFEVTVEISSDREQLESCTMFSNDVDESEASFEILINRSGLGVGDPAPDFTLTDLDGVSYTLSDYRGDVVFITMFSTW